MKTEPRARPGRRRLRAWALAGLTLVGLGGLSGCAGPQVQDYAAEQPPLDLRRYFDGELSAHGVFTDRWGQVKRRFTVRLVGRWQGERGVLEEDFVYSDGQTERRVWRLEHRGGGRYVGQADDVIGEAEGESAGNALRWRYTLRLKVDGREVDVRFDDWMFLVDDRVMINRAEMSKFGLRLGEVTLAFHKPVAVR